MTTREKDEQRALDLVAGRKDARENQTKSASGRLGRLERVGIALWALVAAAGATAAVYHFALAPNQRFLQ